MRWVLLLLIAAALSLQAQELSVSIENWRMKAGDDPRWAAPDFDDSDWEPTSHPRRHTSSSSFFSGFRWYRATVAFPDALRDLPASIAIGPLDEVFDVYINGVLIGAHGSWEPVPAGQFPRPLIFHIPEATRTGPVALVAIRRWTGPSRTNFISLGWLNITLITTPPEIGLSALLHERQDSRAAKSMLNWSLNLAASLAALVAGIISLAVYYSQRGSRETLWLGFALIAEGITPWLGFAVVHSGAALRSLPAGLTVGLYFLTYAFWLLFLASACRTLRIPFLAAAAWSGVNSIAMAGAYLLVWGPVPYPVQVSPIWLGTACAGLAAVVLIVQRRNLGMACLAAALFLFSVTSVWYTSFSRGISGGATLRLNAGGAIIDFRSIPRLAVAVIALAVLYSRYRRESRRQAALDGELAAARLVQESLLEGRRWDTPGFLIDAAYLPASEVGGDFYRELPGPDGSLLVLVGDVSGKGMRAALLAGHISGALSNERSRRPSEILANLNESLIGMATSGFVTCCCARFGLDGTVTVANAGHLTPYMDDRELQVASGLPLGVVPDVQYEDTQVALDGSFVLISDGVVEATNAKGDLFGFDRAKAISGKAAPEIAEAARAWGQTDDITVVTVRRSA